MVIYQKWTLLIIASCLMGCSSSDKRDKKVSLVKLKKVRKETDGGPTLKKVVQGFTDKTSEYGLYDTKAVHLYAPDLNSDGFSDLVILPDFYSTPIFFLFNSKKKRFEKLDYQPFDKNVRASFLSFIDFNNDGLLDIVLGTLNQKTELSKEPLRFFKGYKVTKFFHFKEVPNALVNKEVRPVSSIGILDYNLDGHLDLYQGNWFDLSKGQTKIVPDRLFEGKGLSFSDKSYLLKNEYDFNKESKKFSSARPTFGVSTCDLDLNGYPDLLVTSSAGYKNKMWMNQKAKFKDYAQVSGFAEDDEKSFGEKGGGNSFFSNCTDYNNDGIMDVFLGELSHSYDNETKDKSSILSGSVKAFPPKFIRSEFLHDNQSSWSQADRRGLWLDIDNDGLIDLLTENSGYPPRTRLVLFKQEQDHAYNSLSKELGIDIINPSGSISIDLNQDGMPDIISGQTSIRDSSLKSRIYIFENNLKTKGRRLTVHLSGKKSNLFGIGSTLILKSGKRTQRRWFNPLEGSLPSQGENSLSFGIPFKEKLEKLTVKWPSLRNGKPLSVDYDLRSIKLRNNNHITLYESGKYRAGKRQ